MYGERIYVYIFYIYQSGLNLDLNIKILMSDVNYFVFCVLDNYLYVLFSLKNPKRNPFQMSLF